MNATPDEPGRRPTTADVVIVGSGPAGAAYARVIAERSAARIVMIERGPSLSPTPGANLKNYLAGGVWQQSDRTDVETVAAESLARTGTELWSAARGVGNDFPAAAVSTNAGGMGAHWSCATPQPDAEERGSVIPADEWPELLAESARLLAVDVDAFAGSQRGRLMAAQLQDVFAGALERPVAPMPHAYRRVGGAARWTGVDTVLGDLLSGPHPGTGASLHLVTDALATRVLLDGTADGVTGVEVRDLRDGTTFVVDSARVVVAADSLRTPQLLWASGIRSNALGRYLNEHPMVVATILLGDDMIAGVTLDAAGDTDDERAAVWVPYSPRHRFSGQIENSPGSPAGFEIPELRDASPARIVSLTWFCPKQPRPEDRLEFVPELDADGLPRARIHYAFSEHDESVVRDGIELTRRAGKALGTFVPGQEPTLLPPGLSLHYMGTTRMGLQDDGTSVCDGHSRVWRVVGLWVAGNGVIPTATAGNPTLTSVALAVRGARRLADGIRLATA